MTLKRTLAAGAALTLALLVLAGGCADPYTMYQSTGAQVETGQKIVVMPFMDTRTFLAKNDPHRGDVGVYVRDIFTEVLRERTAGAGAEVTTPEMEQPARSMSTAEVAEIGRRHGADVVVAGQVFSFNNTRAASIPPRAGMFVRVISAKTGALLFVGDHYSAAGVPLGAGNRDDQAELVAVKLVEGFLAQSENALASALGIASATALANIEPETAEAPEAPEMPETPAPPEAPVVLVQSPIVPMRPEEVDELPELGAAAVDAALASIDARAPISERLASISGDELAEDLWESEGDVFDDEETETMETAAAEEEAAEGKITGETPGEQVAETETRPGEQIGEVAAAAAHAGERVVSEPMVFEQPRTFRVELEEDPASVRQDAEALIAKPADTMEDGAENGAARILILPYHDRENPNNLIASTGGGEVVTTLFGTELALDPGITLMWEGAGMATHDRLVGREEAVEMGRLAGADFVMRGQVVEFRRAQSVPSLYSAVISTALLAAQVFFAEMSGVDVATEVYRVEDGMCVMSRRDRAQQKYVVQAEKTVRRLAAGMAESVSRAVRLDDPEEMDPLIDGLEPVTVLSNPK